MSELQHEQYCQDGERQGEDDPDCQACAANEAEMLRQWNAYGRQEYERERNYSKDMIEAGRGHLLSEEQRGEL